MKALILKGPNEPFIFEDVPDPIPQNGEAVAKILACGSGLTIQHVKAGRTKVNFPIIIGHEITAEIIELRGDSNFDQANLDRAIDLFHNMSTSSDFDQFLTLPAYKFL